jgi:antitoxin MazE
VDGRIDGDDGPAALDFEVVWSQSNHMRTQIVPIGNSRGVRIPKTILSELRLEDEVDLSVEGSALVVRRARRPRDGWETAIARAGEQPLLDSETATEFDKSEWQW